MTTENSPWSSPRAARRAPRSATGLDLPVPTAWATRALCAEVDSDVFYPAKGGPTREAKRICSMCESREICLTGALERGERFGIFGGTTPKERRAMSKGATA